MSAIIDARQRQKAIDPQRSFIVQAPAGSGKTELLIQRFLALLSQVERPDRILAMTFTRKAAAEMRNRLLEALAAAEGERPQEAHRAQTFDLARAALEQDRRLGWNLLLNPEILSIQTIDSFNAGLVRKMPWVCRLGGLPEIVEDASLLYLEATQNLLRRLGTPQVGALELEKLLAHLDNQMEFVQQMLVDMLGKRDQWMRHLYRIEGLSPQQILEKSLADLIEKQLGEIVARVPTTLGAEMLACGRIAALNLYDGKERPLLALADAHQFPAALAGDLPIWQGLADLLLTGNNTLRRSGGINVNLGFAASQPVERQRMQRLVSDLSSAGDFIEKLVACRVLPQPRYPAQQWQILECLILLLPQLVAELWLVFRRAGQVDFSEISLMASSSLGASDDPGELLLRLDSVLHHILVDEFQDTSEQQYALLQQL
ncbi:MAG: UvrD-helicase domain-containing protein, partial [Deltaproteobacteria bacterium]|nr:UvrD-helicase domain-containing protein [Deltaproteobacteria bacterium]